MTKRQRYLVTKPGRAGTMRYFWQPSRALRKEGWRPRRLPDDPAEAAAMAIALNAELDASRLAARTDAAPIDARRNLTLDQLIHRYRADPAFLELRPKTRRGYEQCLELLRQWAGDAPLLRISPQAVQRFYRAMHAKTPAYANATITVLRLLFNFYARTRRAGEPHLHNPAALPRLKGSRRIEPRIWTPAQRDTIIAAADALGRPSIGDAVMLNYWVGQRLGDILTLRRDAIRDGRLVLRQSKTGAGISLPLATIAPVMARLDAATARNARGWRAGRANEKSASITATTLVVSEETGRSYTADNFQKVFARVRDHANLRQLWFMHLRHTSVVRLAEAGCSHLEVASITGHEPATVARILRHYLQPTAALADHAFEKRLAYEEQGE